MKRFKRTGLSLLLLICFVMSTFHVSAADELLGTVVDGSLLTDGTEAEGVAYPRARGAYLSSGSGRIAIMGTRSVSVSGSTSAYQSVDQIKVKLHLQRLVNGSWVTVKTLGPKTRYNDYYVSNSNTYSVTGGYYYRVTGTHIVIEDGRSEAAVSSTDGVWVN